MTSCCRQDASRQDYFAVRQGRVGGRQQTVQEESREKLCLSVPAAGTAHLRQGSEHDGIERRSRQLTPIHIHAQGNTLGTNATMAGLASLAPAIPVRLQTR